MKSTTRYWVANLTFETPFLVLGAFALSNATALKVYCFWCAFMVVMGLLCGLPNRKPWPFRPPMATGYQWATAIAHASILVACDAVWLAALTLLAHMVCESNREVYGSRAA